MKKIHKSINIFMLCASLIGAGWMLPDYAQAEVAEVQQSSVATGTVVDESGEPVYGARITVVGTKTMVLTDAQGKFKISNVRKGASLLVSYIGHKSQTVKWDGAALRIQLEESSSTLNEAVVTAMGIVRKEKSLTYATQQIKSDDLMKVQDPNVANSLEGKISGITITPSAGGAGGASQIVLRGSKSILGGSSPLIVVDGHILENYSSTDIDLQDMDNQFPEYAPPHCPKGRGKKHGPLNSYVSLYSGSEEDEEGSGKPLLETLADITEDNPESGRE